jgi:hypothetical protein
MNFDLDAFVSYAHLDDAALVEGQKGWVAQLHRALEIRVGMFLGKSPHIWRDPKLQGNDVFAETLIDLLKRVAVLVSVVSPRYVRSEWTRRELNEFVKCAEQQRTLSVRHKSRIFKVLKTPVPLDQQIPELQELLGYEFFKVDPETGKVHEFDGVFGAEAQQNFWNTLDDLAHAMCDMLEIVEGPERPESPREETAVFLAETTGDLKDQHDAIRRDLQQHGYTVLPARPLSSIGAEVDTAVREDLARCRMSIHLIGKRYSLMPEGALTSLLEIQNELAIERGRQGGFTRLMWIPKGLEIEDTRQQQVIERLRADPRMGQGSDLLESPFDSLRTVIQDALERTRAPQPTEPAAPCPATTNVPGLARVYLVYDERDTALVSPWSDFLFEQGLEVMPPCFKGDEAEVREYHEENLRTSDGVVIFFGAANELWLHRKFRELQKSAGYGRTKPAPVVAVCLLSPKTPEKERFRTHEAFVVPQWDGLSADLWKPIIARLKG